MPTLFDFYVTGFCLHTLAAGNHPRGIMGDIVCHHSTAPRLYASSLDRILVLRELAKEDFHSASASADTCTIIRSVQDNGPPFSCDVSEYRKEAQDHLQLMVNKAELKHQNHLEILAHWDRHRHAAVESALQFASSPERQRQAREGIFKLAFFTILMSIFLWRGIRPTPTTLAHFQPPQQASNKGSPVWIKIEDDDDDEVKLLSRPHMAQLREAPAALPSRARSLPAFRRLVT